MVWGQSKLNTKVDLDIRNKSIADLFTEIELKTDAKFSFNSLLVNQDSIISYQCSNKSTGRVIKELFDNKILAKRVGRHIILIANNKKVVVKKTANIEVILYGTIIDARTKEGIKDVTIYDIYSRETVLTDKFGKFQIDSKLKYNTKTYNIAKIGYNNTVSTIDWSSEKQLKVELLALQEKIDPLHIKEIEYLSAQEKSKFLFGLVPTKVLITTENLDDISEKKITQVSFLPYLGTNWMSKGIIANNFSFNILAGYNGGVDGVEIGGLLNIIDKDVNGLQIAGLSNLVAGNATGVQIAGILNRTKGRVKGVQLSGIINESFDTINGVQIAGISNRASKHIKGAQMSGTLNIASESINGLQLAGIRNRCKKHIIGTQIAGISNVLSDSIIGLQLAGLLNRSGKIVKGVQIAGIRNITMGENNGIQISLINKSKKNNGIQLGLINYSEKGNGISIGLLNFVKNGYRSIELSANEFTQSSIKYKMGSKYFYTIFSFGIRPERPKFRSAGLGFGSQFKLSNRISFTIDATSSVVQIDENQYKYRNLNNRLDLSLDYRISKRLGLFFGPSYNVLVSRIKNEDLASYKDQIIDYSPLFSNYNKELLVHQWLGGNAGLRYSF